MYPRKKPAQLNWDRPFRDATSATHYSRPASVAAQHRRRRGASQRLPRLACGCCTDPFTNRHRSGPRPWGYVIAAEHLAGLALLPAPPDDLDQLRAMWRDEDTRSLAMEIVTGWGVAAA